MTAVRPIIACLGAGRMGRGIAVAFAYAGHAVIMIDVKARSAEQFSKLEAEALGEVGKTLASLSRFGLLAEADADAILARVSVAPVHDMAAALAGAGLVFEGVPEVVELKREVLAAACKCVGPDIVIASTTSTILVDDLSRRGGKSKALSQRALAQSGLSDSAGRNLAGGCDRSRCHRAREGAAGGHRQGSRWCAPPRPASSYRGSRRWP